MKRAILVLSCLVFSLEAVGAALDARPEFSRVDPFGETVEPDKAAAGQQACCSSRGVSLRSARAAYVSFQLLANIPEGGAYSLAVDIAGLKTDLFREWFHFTEPSKSYYPDALVPVSGPYRSHMPEPDNRIEKQSVQPFWVDIWVPQDAKPGLYRGQAKLEAGGKSFRLPLQVQVLPAVVPASDAVAMDHNSYGSTFIAHDYPKIATRSGSGFFESEAFFKLIHSYHRIFDEHRGVFHQLGYGHAGKVGPEFAPALEGSGKKKRVVDWTLFDRHYGPLLDGTALAGTRRGARPIPYVYLPINPEWPASYLWWGQPGFETEFVNVVSEMERHFREKGWTKTVFEVFFNHKKRYKGFEWDGDETRFPEDYQYFAEYARLLKKALPANTPVQFRMRTDASWAMEEQFKLQAGVINFWVCGASMFSWYPDAPKLLKSRGDIVWIYGGTPEVTKNASAVTFEPFRTWMMGVDGYVRWLTVSAGRDPWFHFDGGGLALVYAGDRFGVDGPIPSMRLKTQRNCVQDITLLDSYKDRKPLDELKAEAAKRYNGTALKEWWAPRPAIADRPPFEMNNADIEEASKPVEERLLKFGPSAWENVREYVLHLASEGK